MLQIQVLNGNEIFDFNDYIFNTEAQPLPKALSSQWLELMNNNNSILPSNYNNCPIESDKSMNLNEIWISINS